MEWLGAVVVLLGVIAIFLTTPKGKQLADQLGIDLVFKNRAPQQDRDFLFRVCNDDLDEVARMLSEARRNNPDMSEAEAYRRAIRAHLRDKM